MESELLKSNWRLVGIGRVTENKLLGDVMITFNWLEHNPVMNGDLTSSMQEQKNTYYDQQGHEQTRTAYTNQANEAIWLPGDSNWSDPPDIVRDEQVFIYQYGDSSPTVSSERSTPYFWRDMGLHRDKRRLETRRLVFSGTAEGGKFSYETHYFFEFSAHTKSIILQNSMANEEVAQWNISMLAGEGLLTVSDKVSNLGFTLNSKDDTLKMQNGAGTMILLDKEEIKEYAAGKYTRVVEGDYEEIITGNKIVTVNGKIEESSKTGYSITAPNIDQNGAIWLNGPIGQRGSSAGGYNAKLKGSLDVENKVYAQDFGTPKIVSYNGHWHQGYHGPTSEPKG